MTAQHGAEPGSTGTLATASAETIARTMEVLTWVVNGLGRTDVHAQARQRWGISSRQADRLIHHARAELVAGMEVHRQELLALLLTRTDLVFRKALAADNHGVALGCITAAAKLAQL